jgi:TolA-binding protein
MDIPWNPSVMTGDQCALCEAPLDEHSVERAMEDGSFILICSSCALEQPAGDPRSATAAVGGESENAPPVDAATAWIEKLVQRRAQEEEGLRNLVEVIKALQENVEQWQTSTNDMERQVRALESELSRTKERLRKAEDLLDWTSGEQPAVAGEPAAATGAAVAAEQAAPAAADAPAAALAADDAAEAAAPPEAPFGVDTPATEAPAPAAPPTPVTEQVAATEHVASHFPPHAPEIDVQASGFTIDELTGVQRLFNESTFIEKTRSVRRGLGTPIVNLMRVVGPSTRVLITVAWDIVWYQYLVILEEDAGDEPRVSLFAEGMELHELAASFKQNNATMGDTGRIDASELEVQLLGEGTLITDMTAEEEAALEDATEEIWDRHTMPEFRWDD